MSDEQEPGGPPAAPELQFDKVEPTTTATHRDCASCRKPITHEYFELNGNLLCPACTTAIQKGPPGALLRAAFLGTVAAAVGAAVWLAIIKVSDYELGIIAIGVGFLVGFAVRKGSGAVGGWKYQALAIALTYVSVTAAKVPLLLEGLPTGEHISLPLTFIIALAMPFLMGFENILGILIIGIALYEAWKVNRRLPITGPHRIASTNLIA